MRPFRDQSLDPRFAELGERIQAGSGDVRPVNLPAPRGRPRTPSPPHLTPREQELFLLMITDLPQKEIAAKMGISFGGLKVKMSFLLHKLGCNGRVQLIVRAYTRRLPRDVAGIPEVPMAA